MAKKYTIRHPAPGVVEVYCFNRLERTFKTLAEATEYIGQCVEDDWDKVKGEDW